MLPRMRAGCARGLRSGRWWDTHLPHTLSGSLGLFPLCCRHRYLARLFCNSLPLLCLRCIHSPPQRAHPHPRSELREHLPAAAAAAAEGSPQQRPKKGCAQSGLPRQRSTRPQRHRHRRLLCRTAAAAAAAPLPDLLTPFGFCCGGCGCCCGENEDGRDDVLDVRRPGVVQRAASEVRRARLGQGHPKPPRHVRHRGRKRRRGALALLATDDEAGEAVGEDERVAVHGGRRAVGWRRPERREEAEQPGPRRRTDVRLRKRCPARLAAATASPRSFGAVLTRDRFGAVAGERRDAQVPSAVAGRPGGRPWMPVSPGPGGAGRGT
jgi:hypothetical protein